MGFIISTPSYMYQSPSGYIYRLRIPVDLKDIVGKTEFRYSLRSGILRVAKHRARCIASFVHQLFIKVRNNMEEFTPERISDLVRNYIRETLVNDERCRALLGSSVNRIGTLEGDHTRSFKHGSRGSSIAFEVREYVAPA